jgi:hypothetical protein
MNLKEWQTKPVWEIYEASLMQGGWEPYWDPETEKRLQEATVTCCRCGQVPAYVGMTDGTTRLGFVACGPDCGDWFWFLPAGESQDHQGGSR